MAPDNKLQWIGIEDPFYNNVPALQQPTPGTLPDTRDNSVLPDEARHADRDIFIASYLTAQEIEAQRVIGQTALRNKGALIDDAQDNYIQVTGTLIGRRDSITDEEQDTLVNGFTQILVNDAANEFYKSMKHAHALIDRAATTQRSSPVPKPVKEKEQEPKAVPAKVIERRKLTLMERLRGETIIEYE